MADVELKLSTVPVTFANGTKATARVEGNNAAWQCRCKKSSLPLLGRCYFQFGHDCHTVCPDCARSYRVTKDAKKKATGVEEST
jgi:hypothetical protein